MLKYPMSAVNLCFFTRRSGRAETCGCLLPSPGENRGPDICIPTRNPFMNLWVKAQINAHPRIPTVSLPACPADNLIICAPWGKVKGWQKIQQFASREKFNR